MSPRSSLVCLVYWIILNIVVAVMPDIVYPEVPELPSNKDVIFYMFPTPEYADNPFIGDIAGLLPSQPLTMVFHGFKGDITAASMLSIKEAMMLSGVNNVVLVDWGPLANSNNRTALSTYHHVRDNGVNIVSEVAAQWLRHVMYHKDITADQVHLVGFSLGAHCVGIVGYHHNSTLGRITGLDPPQFGYGRVPIERRLDLTDGQFVNVIHTTGGILGYRKAIGHVDFFPNGDVEPQNGCPSHDPIQLVVCSHYFSYLIFAETVYHPNSMLATECSSWSQFTKGKCDMNVKAIMGYATPNTTRGSFYMKLNMSPPYGEDDPSKPMTDKLKRLLTYSTEDMISANDVVHFLMHKEPTERSADLDYQSGDIEVDQLGDSRVMRVKNSRRTTTTTDPPPFLDNHSTLSQSPSLVFVYITGVNVVRTMLTGADE